MKTIDQVHAYLRKRGTPVSRAQVVAEYGKTAGGALVYLLKEGSVRRVASTSSCVNDWQYVKERPAKRANPNGLAIDAFLSKNPWSTLADIRVAVPEITRQRVDQLLKAGLTAGRYERRDAQFIGDFMRWRLSAKGKRRVDNPAPSA